MISLTSHNSVRYSCSQLHEGLWGRSLSQQCSLILCWVEGLVLDTVVQRSLLFPTQIESRRVRGWTSMFVHALCLWALILHIQRSYKWKLAFQTGAFENYLKLPTLDVTVHSLPCERAAERIGSPRVSFGWKKPLRRTQVNGDRSTEHRESSSLCILCVEDTGTGRAVEMDSDPSTLSERSAPR